MYLEFFGLNTTPFGMSPRIDFVYQSAAFEESMAHLVYGLEHKEAIVLVTGPIGTGKTMVLQSFLSRLSRHFEFALVTNTRVNAVELLKLMLEDLGVAFPSGADKSDLLILFKGFLRKVSAAGGTVLLVVDEAQNLSVDVLEELRLLTNLGQGESQPVQIILVGQPELETLLNRPELVQLRQRIRVHYAVEPLSRDETEAYLNHRMAVAGCPKPAFSQKAIDRIHELSSGIPRLVNTFADSSLLSAFVAGDEIVAAHDVSSGDGKAPRVEALPDVSAGSSSRRPLPVNVDHRSDQGRATGNARLNNRFGGGIGWWVVGLLVVAAVVFAWLLQTGFLARHSDRVQDAATSTSKVPSPAGTVSEKHTDDVAVQDVGAPTLQTAPVNGASEFFIHFASFRSAELADKLAEKWTRSGSEVEVKPALIRGVEWHRVYLGPYESKELAKEDAHKLVDQGAISYFAIKRLEGTH